MIPIRPLLALLLTISLLLGTSIYIEFAKAVRPAPITIASEVSEDQFVIEVERTFDCVGDRIFELNALEINFKKGPNIFESSDGIKANQPIRKTITKEVEIGDNEIVVTANRSMDDLNLGVMKVTIFQNEVPLCTSLIPSDPGLTTVSGALSFKVIQPKQNEHE